MLKLEMLALEMTLRSGPASLSLLTGGITRAKPGNSRRRAENPLPSAYPPRRYCPENPAAKTPVLIDMTPEGGGHAGAALVKQAMTP